ncbi:MAG TPA: YdeI/OmpD-associated family protein, partial [Tepidisphaeraceae bacterium]|nr:YdeI/OmpD-associated family protein [Tepidisphaeraceae bacterium]
IRCMGAAKAQDVDEYIANAPEHTRPILVKLRRIFQRASPKLGEAIKWGVPCFVYKGPVGGFAAYQKHVSWGLWKSRLLNDPDGLLDSRGIVMGGKIATVAEIPPAPKLTGLIRQVIALNEAGIKHPKPPDPDLPADFKAAMKKSGKASKHYAAFTPARKWQYVNWINNAKRAETRAKRIQTAVERIGEGKTMK